MRLPVLALPLLLLATSLPSGAGPGASAAVPLAGTTVVTSPGGATYLALEVPSGVTLRDIQVSTASAHAAVHLDYSLYENGPGYEAPFVELWPLHSGTRFVYLVSDPACPSPRRSS
jgi:hypothetical protein